MNNLFAKAQAPGAKHKVTYDEYTGNISEVAASVEVRKGMFEDLRYRYATTTEHLEEIKQWLAGHKLVGLDLETSGLKPTQDVIATMQLGIRQHPSGISAWVIDVRMFTAVQLEYILDWLESRAVTKLGQNLGFEYGFLRHHYGVRLRGVADTQVAELACRAGLFQSVKGKSTAHLRAGYTLCSMKELMRRYAGIEIDKGLDVRLSFNTVKPGRHGPDQIVYAASDVVYPFIIAESQKEVIAERGLRNVIKLEMESLPVIHEMEYQGMRVDQAAWRELWQEAVTELASCERTLDTLIRGSTLQDDLFDTADVKSRPIFPKSNTPLNYSSFVHVRWAIKAYCQRVNWPVRVVSDLAELKKLKIEHGQEWLTRQLDNGRDVTEDNIPDWVLPETQFCILLESSKISLTLARARKQLPAEFVGALLAYSKMDQRASAFGNEWLVKNIRKTTGRVHSAFHQLITNTGRLSSQPNLQNIPNDPRYRKCFIPAPGYSFVIADYSQQEPRLLAQECQDPVYVNTYLQADDLYMSVCEAMLGRRPDLSTEAGKLERQVFKIIVLSMAYRSGVAKLRDQLTLGLADAIEMGTAEAPTQKYAAEMHKRFFEVHARVRQYQEECSNGADPANESAPRFWDEMVGAFVTYVRAPCGRLHMFGPESINTYTEASNAPIQGGSASMIKAAACLLQREIDKRGWQDLAYVVNIVHDEIVTEAHDSIAAEIATLQQQAMVSAGQLYCPSIPVVAEFPKNSTGVVPYWTKGL